VTGAVDLYEAPHNTGDHRVFASHDEPREATSVRTTRVDDLGLSPPVDVVKIDVQGAEQAVVRGMERLLAASPGVFLSVEFWPYGIVRFGGEPRDVLAYYRSLGFELLVQQPEEPGLLPWEDDQILAHCRGKDGWDFVTLALSRRFETVVASRT
jgi:hypothetical protein